MADRRLLILTSRPPIPADSGAKKRILSVAEAFRRRGYVVSLVTVFGRPSELKGLRSTVTAKLFSEIVPVRIGYLRRAIGIIKGVFSKTPLQVAMFRSPSLTRELRELSEKHRFDVAIFHLIRMAEYVDDISAEMHIIEMTDSLALNFYRRAQDSNGRGIVSNLGKKLFLLEARRLTAYELHCLKKFDHAVVVSKIDKEFMVHGAPAGDTEMWQRLVVIPLGVDARRFDPVHPPEKSTDLVVFLGKMDYAPNIEAAVWFAKNVLPHILKRRPNVRFQIIGGSPTEQVLDLGKGKLPVEVTGWVEDLRPYLGAAALAVAPMRSGTGMQTKILESMAYGLPVVASPLGAAALELVWESEIAVADSDEDFAIRVVSLLEDDATRLRLAKNGRQAVLEKYDSHRVLDRYPALINGI